MGAIKVHREWSFSFWWVQSAVHTNGGPQVLWLLFSIASEPLAVKLIQNNTAEHFNSHMVDLEIRRGERGMKGCSQILRLLIVSLEVQFLVGVHFNQN